MHYTVKSHDDRSKLGTMEQPNKLIARIWRGRTRPDDAERYRHYLYRERVLKLRELGAQEVKLLQRIDEDAAHFVVNSYWESIAAMKAWSDDETDKTRFLDNDTDLLIDLEDDLELPEVCHAEPA